MRNSKARDFTVGFFVLIGLGAIAYLSFRIGGLDHPGRGGVHLFAKFDSVADLRPKAPVQLAGVTVGQITSISLADDFRARVDFTVERDIKLPVDTEASIVTAGLLGDRYLALDPIGNEEGFLKEGDEIAYTQKALVLENLVGKFLTNVEDKGAEK
jgi:phospholipid/cholesterol/gamma-HCH transport system substrate-binding protein